MNRDLTVWLALGVLALLWLALLVVMVATRRSSRRDVSLAHAEIGDLRVRVQELEHIAAPVVPAPTDYLITRLGQEPSREDKPGPALDRQPDRALFADIVLRETVVKAAALAHGVRRGVAPATRNRIRFEMKQEARRSRKERRSELKAALRDRHARQRETLAEEAS